MSLSTQSITRRSFLNKTAQGLFTVGASGLLSRSSQAQESAGGKKVGWAIVGLGSLSMYQILPAFAHCQKSRLVALVSGHRDKAERLAGQYGVDTKNIYNYQNYDSLKENPDVDAIYIVLPNGMHAEYTIRGAKAGKHILCEKPMANTPKECQQMIDACRMANRKLMIAYRCQYEPYNLAAMQIIRNKEIGTLRQFVADHGFSIGDPRQWRLNKALAGGGSMMDIGIYSLQAARYISGEEPVELSASMSSPAGDPRFHEVEADVNFVLRFPSGALANCTSSYSYRGANRYRAFTTEGWMEMDPATSYHGIHMVVSHNGPPTPRTFEDGDQFAVEMEHMSDCVLTDKTPKTPGEEGLRDMKLIAAIYDSARNGKTIKFS